MTSFGSQLSYGLMKKADIKFSEITQSITLIKPKQKLISITTTIRISIIPEVNSH